MEAINYQKIANDIRKKILKMHFLSQESHIGSALSCADILTVLYFKILSIDPQNPLSENRDRFLLSKGHAASALYAVLSEKKFFDEKILDSFCQNGGKLPGHSTRNTIPGVEASAGSLGHGLPMATGIALAGKKDSKDYKIFVLISDGECDEGTTWESALFASHHKLDNLTVIIDYNKFQALGKTNEILNLEPLKEKWLAFGWQAIEINGHDFNEIEKALKAAPYQKGKPNVVIAHTIKGKGISFMENKLPWHYKSPNENEYKLANEELN